MTAPSELARRVTRMLYALDRPQARPYIHKRPDGRWQVTHQRAPGGMFYDTLPDAVRVASGCVA